MKIKIRSTSELKTIIDYYADMIDAPEDIRPEYSSARHDCSTVVRSNGKYYYCAVYERGVEVDPFQTQDIMEFLFKIMWRITFAMGTNFWEETKDKAVDCRRYIFYKQLQLMEILGKYFYDMCKDDILTTIGKYPFNDGHPNTLEFFEEYYQNKNQR